MTYEYIIVYNLTDDSIIKEFRSSDVYGATYEDSKRVKLEIYDQKNKRTGTVGFELKQPMGNKLTNEIKSICKIYRPVYGFDYKIVDGMESFIQKQSGAKWLLVIKLSESDS